VTDASIGGLRLAVASFCAAGALCGCGDRGFPEGFADQAARDESSFNARGSAPVVGAARGPSTTGGGSAEQDGGGWYSPAAAVGQDGGSEATTEATTEASSHESERRAMTAAIVAELKLPPPQPAVVIGGEEPYKKHAESPRFVEFRRMAGRYIQLKRELLPLGRKLADGTATPEERALHNRIEEAMAQEFRPLNAYLWDERWTEADRAAMGWILFVPAE